MLFRLQIGPDGLKQEEAAAENVINSVVVERGGGALLAAAVGGGRVCRVVGCNQLFFFFAVHNFSTQVFPVFSVFFWSFSLLLVLVTVFLTLVKSPWTTFLCQFRCENIVVTMMKFSIGFARHSSETAHATCPMPPHGSASIFVQFRESAREINFNRSRPGKKEEYNNFCNKELSYNSFFCHFLQAQWGK